MFNWFQRSSKSASGARKRTSPARHRPASPVSPGLSPARIAPAGIAPAGLGAGGFIPAGDPQSLARLPDSARQLSPDAQRILAALPPAVALGRSCAQYPQAVEKLLKHWRNPNEFRATLDSMVIDSRGGRQGFPFAIVREFSALREYYDLYVNPVKTSGWGSVHAR